MREIIGAGPISFGTLKRVRKVIHEELDRDFPATFWPMLGVGFITNNAALLKVEGSFTAAC
jgi:hypothetical protein